MIILIAFAGHYQVAAFCEARWPLIQHQQNLHTSTNINVHSTFFNVQICSSVEGRRRRNPGTLLLAAVFAPLRKNSDWHFAQLPWHLKWPDYLGDDSGYGAWASIGATVERSGLETLTEREKDVLRLLASGFEVKTAAEHLNISANTANERLREARRKLHASSSRHAARLLAQHEAMDPKKSGDRFAGVVTRAPEPSNRPWSQKETEADSADAPTVSQTRAAYVVSGEPFGKLPYLPLRRSGEKGNAYSRPQRLIAIAELSIKLITVVAIVCLVAVLLNSLIEIR
jgi:DNA-binding CsgD family transcriptional regulator